MSVDTYLKQLLGSLVNGGCHIGVNRSVPIVTPYIVFYEISGMPLDTISQYSGMTEYRYQVDVFARSPEESRGIATGAVRSAILSAELLKASLIFQSSGQYSELDKTYQYITEYKFFTP